MVDVARTKALLREHGPGIAVEMIVNFIGPYVVYSLAKKDLGEVGALIASCAPPIVWSLAEFARRRRVDAVSIFVLAGIALSLLAFFGGGGPRFLQLREKLVTALIGLVFIGSAVIGRPLIYYLARAGAARRDPAGAETFEANRDNAGFRRVMTTMTLVWGSGLLVDAMMSGVLVFSLSIKTYLLAGPAVGYATTGSLALWTWWYARRAQRRGDARRAAEAAARAG